MRPRTQIFIAIIGGCFAIFSAIILSPHWSKYFFPKQYLAQEKLDPSKTTNTKVVIDTVNRPSGKREEKEGVDDIKITKIELCPRNFKIPSYFYFEVNNSGSKTIKNLTVTVNLGKASYAYFDITKNLKLTTLTDSNDKSFLKIACPEIKENENSCNVLN